MKAFLIMMVLAAICTATPFYFLMKRVAAENQLTEYNCTEVQMKRVEEYTRICRENTYLGEVNGTCFKQAIRSVCK